MLTLRFQDQTCNGGLQSYCCSGFKPPPSKSQLKEEAANAAKDAAEAAAEQAALDVAAKAFCRVAVPALLAPLELAEDLIPIIGELQDISLVWRRSLLTIDLGEILDIAELAATPALIQGCVKGIEKEGKAEFKVFGKKHTLTLGEYHTILHGTKWQRTDRDGYQTSPASCRKHVLLNQAMIQSRLAQHVTSALVAYEHRQSHRQDNQFEPNVCAITSYMAVRLADFRIQILA